MVQAAKLRPAAIVFEQPCCHECCTWRIGRKCLRVICLPCRVCRGALNFCAHNEAVGPPDIQAPGRFHPVPTHPVFAPVSEPSRESGTILAACRVSNAANRRYRASMPPASSIAMHRRYRSVSRRQARPTMRPRFVVFKRIVVTRRCCMHARSRTLDRGRGRPGSLLAESFRLAPRRAVIEPARPAVDDPSIARPTSMSMRRSCAHETDRSCRVSRVDGCRSRGRS